MICPQCGEEVKQVWGTGEFPNSSWSCQGCQNKELRQFARRLLLVPPLALVVAVGIAFLIWLVSP